MKSQYTRWHLWCGIVFALTALLGCKEGHEQSETFDVRVFITDSIKEKNLHELRGTFAWRSERRLGQSGLAAVADTLFDPEPTWGSYIGVGQAVLAETNIQIHLTVALNSLDSVAPFSEFCKTLKQKDGVVLIYSQADGLFNPPIEEIIDEYTETTNTDQAATTITVPDTRDGQVLDTLLLHLLADPEFDLTRVATNGTTIVLHTRTPEQTGFLLSQQIRSEIDSKTLPRDAEQDLRRRNSPPNVKPDTYQAVEASFTNLTFSAGIVVADLSPVWNQIPAYVALERSYPTARGWVRPYLPGYSKDGSRAIVRAGVGPTPHGATVTALLERSGDKWVVKWHSVAEYV